MTQFGLLNWRLVLVFAFLGPFVGMAPMLFASALAGGGIAELVAVAPIFLAWSYLFGVLPATITGLVLPSALQLVPKTFRATPWAQLAVAFVTGLIITWLLFTAFTPFKAHYFGLIGGASASACTLVAIWLSVGPNNSFNPMPLRGTG